MKVLFKQLFAAALGAGVAALWFITEKDNSRHVPQESTPVQSAEKTIQSKNQTTLTESKDFDKIHQPIKYPKQITATDLESWLSNMKHHPDAFGASQVIAGILTNNSDLVRSGIESDPNNPHLLFIGATHQSFPLSNRLELSNRFFQQDPKNAFAAYIHSANLFKAGEIEQGIEVLRDSVNRSTVNDYTAETLLLMEDAYIASGQSLEAAKLGSFSNLQLPYLSQLHALANSIQEQQGILDEGKINELRSLSSMMGMRVGSESESGLIINRLSGLALEEKTLQGIDKDSPSHYDGLTVDEVLQEIAAERNQVAELTPTVPDIVELYRDNPDLFIRYVDRIRLSGEMKALQWLQRQTPE